MKCCDFELDLNPVSGNVTEWVQYNAQVLKSILVKKVEFEAISSTDR